MAGNSTEAWTNGSRVIRAILEFSATAVPSGNYSNAYAQFRLSRGDTAQTFCEDNDNTLTIDCSSGGRVVNWQGNYYVQNAAGWGGVIASASWQIPHDSNGHKSISLSATFHCPQGAGSYIPYNYSCTLSLNCDLDTIPRGSIIGTIFAFNFEDTFSVPVTKYSDSFTDDLTIKLGSATIKTITGYTNGTAINLTDDELLAAYNALGENMSASTTFETVTKSSGTQIGTSSGTATGTAAGTVHVKTGGDWKRAVPHVKAGGVWKKAIMLVKDTDWKRGINGKDE